MIKTYSIRSQLLKWLLIPTLILVLIDSSMLYHFAGNLEQIAFDRALKDTANDIVQFIKRSSAESLVAIDQETEQMLLSDSVDKMYYSVIDDKGKHLLGEAGFSYLPIVKLETKRWLQYPQSEPSFYFDTYNSEAVRVVVFPTKIQIAHSPANVYVLVAETLNKRKQISEQILLWILVPQLVLLLAAGVLVLVGIKRGLSSLWDVNDALASRSFRDLEPIRLANTPREIKRLVDSANGLMAKLDHAISSQGRFIADAAHQLRTPLAGISAQIELANQAKGMPEIKDRLEKISISAERLIHLVNQLLTLEKNQVEVLSQLTFEKIEMVSLLKNVMQELSPHAELKHIKMVFESDVERVCILGEKTRIYDLVYNLMDNAIRYTPNNGKVTTSLNIALADVYLIVEDNGIGIPEGELELIFERFYRGSQTKTYGTGLGLSIVKEIAALHDATVEVESKTGEVSGTQFKVRFNRLIETQNS